MLLEHLKRYKYILLSALIIAPYIRVDSFWSYTRMPVCIMPNNNIHHATCMPSQQRATWWSQWASQSHHPCMCLPAWHFATPWATHVASLIDMHAATAPGPDWRWLTRRKATSQLTTWRKTDVAPPGISSVYWLRFSHMYSSDALLVFLLDPSALLH